MEGVEGRLGTSRAERPQPSPLRVNILGVGVSAISLTQALVIFDAWIASGEQHYVCVTPVHGIMDCQPDPDLRRIFNASGLTTPDGMPLVWLLRLMGHKHVTRVYGPDLMLAVCEHSVGRAYRHFFYGGGPGVAERLADRLQARVPGLEIAGMFTPPFRPLTPDEDRDVVQKVNAASPHLVWVGISTPKQERWMAEHLGKVRAPVMIGVGAAFDFLSGAKRQAPRWMQRNGLEWAFRLANEPSRLWRRYLRYPRFAALLLLQALRLRSFPLV